MTRPRPLAELLQVFIGPGLWFAHFSFIYGAEALICRDAAGGPLIFWTGAAATLAALAALVVFTLMLARQRSAHSRTADHTGAAFLRSVALLLAFVSMLGVAWTALPLVLVKACGA
jgi:hypothetical protein